MKSIISREIIALKKFRDTDFYPNDSGTCLYTQIAKQLRSFVNGLRLVKLEIFRKNLNLAETLSHFSAKLCQ